MSLARRKRYLGYDISDGRGDMEGQDDARGVLAVETSALILAALADFEGQARLKEIAQSAGMPPAKAHRYLSSMVRVGIAARDPVSGRYGLGPVALNLAFSALRGLNITRLGLPHLCGLRDDTGCTSFVGVLGPVGPTILMVEDALDPFVVSARPGMTFPTVQSATGRLFAAYSTSSKIDDFIARDLRPPFTTDSFGAILADVRRRGMARTIGELNSGISALSAPVFDYKGLIVASMTVLGVRESFDPEWEGANAVALRRAARRFSTDLGHRPD